MKSRRLAQLAHKHQNQLKICLKILAKVKHIQHMEDTTAGPDMYSIIWAYHLPSCLPYGNLTQTLPQGPNCPAFLSEA
jgi:hypothetical protein